MIFLQAITMKITLLGRMFFPIHQSSYRSTLQVYSPDTESVVKKSSKNQSLQQLYDSEDLVY
jgi:hypothetical protein